MSERLEVALVRELENAHSSGRTPAVVEHASAYQWANACHDLFESGRIDVCEYFFSRSKHSFILPFRARARDRARARYLMYRKYFNYVK